MKFDKQIKEKEKQLKDTMKLIEDESKKINELKNHALRLDGAIRQLKELEEMEKN